MGLGKKKKKCHDIISEMGISTRTNEQTKAEIAGFSVLFLFKAPGLKSMYETTFVCVLFKLM